MADTYFYDGESYAVPATSRSIPGTVNRAVQRLPTDQFYVADVDIFNMVVGSAWFLGYDDNGTYTELDKGTSTLADFTISNVPAYANPFTLELRVRNASGSPRYENDVFFTQHSSNGSTSRRIFTKST